MPLQPSSTAITIIWPGGLFEVDIRNTVERQDDFFEDRRAIA